MASPNGTACADQVRRCLGRPQPSEFKLLVEERRIVESIACLPLNSIVMSFQFSEFISKQTFSPRTIFNDPLQSPTERTINRTRLPSRRRNCDACRRPGKRYAAQIAANHGGLPLVPLGAHRHVAPPSRDFFVGRPNGRIGRFLR